MKQKEMRALVRPAQTTTHRPSYSLSPQTQAILFCWKFQLCHFYPRSSGCSRLLTAPRPGLLLPLTPSEIASEIARHSPILTGKASPASSSPTHRCLITPHGNTVRENKSGPSQRPFPMQHDLKTTLVNYRSQHPNEIGPASERHAYVRHPVWGFINLILHSRGQIINLLRSDIHLIHDL